MLRQGISKCRTLNNLYAKYITLTYILRIMYNPLNIINIYKTISIEFELEFSQHQTSVFIHFPLCSR